jgi:hypothetical protein
MRKQIGDIASIQTGYQFREKLEMASAGTRQVIQAKDIDEFHNHRLVASSLWRVTPKRDTAGYEVGEGDVIFLSKGRRNFATVIEGLPASPPTIPAGYFLILRLRAGAVLPQYLAWAINQPAAQGYLRSARRGTNIPFITKDAFSDLQIDVPPLEVQQRVVALDELAWRESGLLKRLQQKRTELIRGICQRAIRQSART